MTRRLYIRDDNGYAWFYNNQTGKIQLAEDDSYPVNQRGYACDNLEGGIGLLMKYGYITKATRAKVRANKRKGKK